MPKGDYIVFIIDKWYLGWASKYMIFTGTLIFPKNKKILNEGENIELFSCKAVLNILERELH